MIRIMRVTRILAECPLYCTSGPNLRKIYTGTFSPSLPFSALPSFFPSLPPLPSSPLSFPSFPSPHLACGNNCVYRNVLISCCHQCRICVIDDLRLIIFLRVIAPRPVMCSFMLICQCCFAIVKVLLKKVTYLLTYLPLEVGPLNPARWHGGAL